MSIREKLPFGSGKDPFEDLVKGLQGIKGDADAVALLPYDDGTFFLKPAKFDKSLIGGQGGYETPDGDKIAMDGDGQPVKDLLGVPMLLAIDPTEHAAAVEPIKALVAQKENIGEWLRVDSKGNIIEVGDALEAASDAALQSKIEGLDEPDVGIGGSMVDEELSKQDWPREMTDKQKVTAVLEELAERGDLTKIYDIAPPAAPVLKDPSAAADGGTVQMGEDVEFDEETGEPVATGELAPGDGDDVEDVEVEVERATHIAVDQSKAKDLLPTTTSTTELNVALDKARMEEHEEGQRVSDILLGGVAGFVGTLVTAGVVGLMFMIM